MPTGLDKARLLTVLFEMQSGSVLSQNQTCGIERSAFPSICPCRQIPLESLAQESMCKARFQIR